MDQLMAMRAFTRVVESGSFTRAADSLNMPIATLSKLVKSLEAHLEIRLLHRTTRRVQLTSDGELLLEKARSLLFDVQTLEGLFHRQNGPIDGRLTVDVPSRIARRMIVPALPDFFVRSICLPTKKSF